jgi:hypothetical protein
MIVFTAAAYADTDASHVGAVAVVDFLRLMCVHRHAGRVG